MLDATLSLCERLCTAGTHMGVFELRLLLKPVASSTVKSNRSHDRARLREYAGQTRTSRHQACLFPHDVHMNPSRQARGRALELWK